MVESTEGAQSLNLHHIRVTYFESSYRLHSASIDFCYPRAYECAAKLEQASLSTYTPERIAHCYVLAPYRLVFVIYTRTLLDAREDVTNF